MEPGPPPAPAAGDDLDSDSSTTSAEAPRPPTVLDTVLTSLDNPNLKVMVSVISQVTPGICIPAAVRVLGEVFSAETGTRFRRGDRILTVKAPTADAAQYITKYAKGLFKDHGCDLVGNLPPMVTLTTCGVRFLPDMKSHWANWTWSYAGVRAAVERCGYHGVDWVLDCRGFDDPNDKSEVRSHTGYLPAIQRGVILNEAFVKFLVDAKRLITSYAGQASCHIVLMCKSGRHRSVCIAAVLESILWDKTQVVVHHASQQRFWKYLCGGPSRCWDCHARDDTLYALVRMIWGP